MSFTNPYPASRLTLDATNSLSSGLVGFWPLTDGSGSTTAKDITSNANDGTESGGVSWAATDIGTAASFDGFDDRFDVDDAGDFDFGTGDFSVSAWVYYDTTPAGFTQIVTRGDTSLGTACWFGIYKTSSSHSFIFDVDDNISKVSTTSSVSATSGAWFHVVGVRNSGGTNVIYINGVSTGTASDNGNSISQTGVSNQELRIGCQRVGGTYQEFHDGNIQNVRVYNRALSATEVATLYNRPWEATNYGNLWPYSPPAPSSATLSTDTAATSLNVDLEGWWLCTDNSGTTLVDISGNSVNGTIGGTVGWDTTALGTAIEPDGSSGRADASVSLTGYPITMAAWFKTPSASAADECIMSVADSSVGTNQLRMIIENSTSKLEANGFDGSVVRAAASTTSVDDDEWHLGVAVFASSTSRKIYVDGVLEGTETSSQTMTAFDRASLAVTADSTPAAYFGGNIQNARVWSRALSADEINLLYERPFEGITYGDAFHYDPPTPSSLTPLTSDSINNSQVGWWPLTETDNYASGAADISGNGYTGTKNGTITSEAAPVGTVARLDGTASHFVPGSILSDPTTCTVSGWVKTTVAQRGDIFSIGNTGLATPLVRLSINETTGAEDNVSFNTRDNSSSEMKAISADVNVTDGIWHHVVGVMNSKSSIDVYFDGALVGTDTGSLGTITLNTSAIGCLKRNTTAIFLDGDIANVRVWSRALSADEIWSIYENPWLGSAYSDAAAAVRFLINGFRNPLISGGLVR